MGVATVTVVVKLRDLAAISRPPLPVTSLLVAALLVVIQIRMVFTPVGYRAR